MKNSIEEDIARIAKLITTKFNNDYSIDNKDKEALEHILSDYKRVLKENEEYKKAIDVVNKEKADWIKAYQEEKDKQFDLINKISSNDFIQKQKVKDRIEEYKNMLKTCNKAKDKDRIKALNERILELQELLEKNKIK